jgi:hypothetical protein
MGSLLDPTETSRAGAEDDELDDDDDEADDSRVAEADSAEAGGATMGSLSEAGSSGGGGVLAQPSRRAVKGRTTRSEAVVRIGRMIHGCQLPGPDPFELRPVGGPGALPSQAASWRSSSPNSSSMSPEASTCMPLACGASAAANSSALW